MTVLRKYRQITEKSINENAWDIFIRFNLFHTVLVNPYAKLTECYTTAERKEAEEKSSKIVVYSTLNWLQGVITHVIEQENWMVTSPVKLAPGNEMRLRNALESVQQTMRELIILSQNPDLRKRLTDVNQDAPDDYFLCPDELAVPAIEAMQNLVTELSYDEEEEEVVCQNEVEQN